ncbi:hypothetical protein ACFL9S_03685 [Erwinia sp. AnSW2-5]|uniref:hypothetical protein n=1 Tax=Erwinia sp. AnSW2-5 TaxID=3367692 RepID=UPI00385A922D
MNRILYIAVSLILLSGCDVPTEEKDNTPEYVKNAKSDVGAALVANVYKNPDFKCESIPANDGMWSMGCFIHEEKPGPFLLFAVVQNNENPPFDYKLFAVNGKAKQLAETPSLQMFKIDVQNNMNTDYEKVIQTFINEFVTNKK